MNSSFEKKVTLILDDKNSDSELQSSFKQKSSFQNFPRSINELKSQKKNGKMICTIGQIEEISTTDFKNMEDIIVLQISNNLITKIQNLNQLKKLQELDLSYNRIEVLENIENLSLSALFLSHNRIHSIFLKKGINSLKNLDLSYNMLDSFTHDDKFPALTTLNLSHCFLTDFSSLYSLKTLTKLILSNNRICDEEPFASSLLLYLDVSHNNLTSLLSFRNFSHLQYLDISYNPISNESFNEINFSINELKELHIDGTMITKLCPLLTIFPNLEKITLKELKGIKKDDFLNFIDQCHNLKAIDIRGLFYGDPTSFLSFGEFKKRFPEQFDDYMSFRKEILQKVKYFPFELDGIVAESPDEEYIEPIYKKSIEEDNNMYFNGQTLSPDQQKELLIHLLEQNNELRKKLGMPEREFNLEDLEKMTPKDLQNLIRDIFNENEELQRRIYENKDFNDKLRLAMKIMRDTERMKAQMENREKREIREPNITQTTIDKFIAKIVDKYRRVRQQYESWILINDSDLIEKCVQKIFKYAMNPMLPDEPTALERGSREYNLVHKWLNLKMQHNFHVKKLVKLNTFKELTQKMKQFKWMQLVVTLAETDVDHLFVVADHCGFFESGKYKFLICALDSGKQVVSYKNEESLSLLRKSQHNYHTKLFYYKGQHAILVNDQSRIVPLYSICINVA